MIRRLLARLRRRRPPHVAIVIHGDATDAKAALGRIARDLDRMARSRRN